MQINISLNHYVLQLTLLAGQNSVNTMRTQTCINNFFFVTNKSQMFLFNRLTVTSH